MIKNFKKIIFFKRLASISAAWPGRLGFGLLCASTMLAAADSRSAEPGVEETRPRVSLVLSGGGARGLAHVGVLQVLEELRVPVDCIVGTSMGALVGGAYASGVRPADMRATLRETDIASLFIDLPPRAQIPQRVKRDDYKPLFDFTLGYNDGEIRLPTGASAGYKFELFLKDLVGPGASVAGLDFDALSTPYRAIATDLENGDMKVFDHGDLPKVMRASMSLPALVAPVDIDGRTYVDGGLVRNLPVDIGRSLCGDVIVAVNLGTPLKTRDQLRNVIDVAGQSINLLTEQNVKRSLTELSDQDILIEPDLKGFEPSDFDSGDLIIERGVQAARQIANQLERLAVDVDAYDIWLAQRESQRLPSPLITAIEAASNERFSETVIKRDLDVEAGDAFSREQLHSDLARLYGRADFSYLGYSVVPVDDGAVVNIEADEKPWGPGYLKFGIGVAADFTSPAQPNLAASYRRTWANSLGAEWRVDGQIGYESFLGGEFLQPFQERDGIFVAPHADARRRFIQFYGDDRRLGQLRINSVLGGIDLGLTGATAELRLGPYVADIHADPDFGTISSLLPSLELTQVGVKLAAVADHLDAAMFPRVGWLAAIGARTTDKDWGSEDEYTVAQVTLRGVKSIGKHTLALRAEWGDGVNDELPVYESFQLGGPLRLSGLFLDQLTGTRYNLGSINYYRQYSRLPSQFGRGLYVGMSLESGRINDPLMKEPWDWVTSGSIYWGADTILGAIYIGYGQSSLKQGIMYLTIGPRF